MEKVKLYDKPISDGPHPSGSGFQKIYRFENDYGASVVRFRIPIGSGFGSYTDNEDEVELAVIKFKGKENDSFDLVYDTPITNDVIGHLTEDEANKILQEIKNLK